MLCEKRGFSFCIGALESWMKIQYYDILDKNEIQIFVVSP